MLQHTLKDLLNSEIQGFMLKFQDKELQTFGCVTVRTASSAFSRSPAWKGPRRPPPDIGLRGSGRPEPPEFCLAGAENFLSPAKAEYLRMHYNNLRTCNKAFTSAIDNDIIFLLHFSVQ